MKKTVLAAIAVTMFLCALPHAFAGGQREGPSLDDAIRQAAENLHGNLPPGTRVAIVAFESETNNLSDFIMDGLTGVLRGRGVEVAERRTLGLITNELNLSLDGSVSDESALSIGRMQAAEFVVTGRLWDIGQVSRLTINAIHTETAVGANVPSMDIRNDSSLRNKITAINRQDPTVIAAVQPAATENIIPQSAGSYMDRGMMFLGRGDFDIAILDLTEAIRRSPDLAGAYFWRAWAHKERGAFEFAIADFTQVIRINPNDSSAFNNRGFAFARMGDDESAMADYIQAIRIDPNNAAAYNNRGMVHINRGELIQALADFDQAIRLNPFNSMSFLNRGWVHYERGEFDRALYDFSRAIRLDPSISAPYSWRGTIHYNRGDLNRAIADWSRTIRLAPDDEWARFNRGRAHMDRSYAHYRNGDRQLELVELNRAIEDFEAALRINPNNPDAWEWLEEALGIRGW